MSEQKYKFVKYIDDTMGFVKEELAFPGSRIEDLNNTVSEVISKDPLTWEKVEQIIGNLNKRD